MDSGAKQAQSEQCRAAAAVQTHAVRRAAVSAVRGAVTVTLHRRGPGILLELVEHRPSGCRIVVVTSFTDARSFEEWCTDDPLRFEHPIVHQQVRRHAEELWRAGS